MPVSLKARNKQSPLFARLSPHQQDGVSVGASTDGLCLFFAQRTGKTWVTCGILERLDAQEVMIVGLKTNLESTWRATLESLLPHYSVFNDLGSYLQFRKDWKTAWGDTPCYSILLINYESLPAIIKKARKQHWDVIAYDEAQRLKKRSSLSSRLAKRLVRSADHRYALTGTPMDRSPVDLWAIMRFVKPEVLGSRWADFEEEYIEPVNIDLKRARGQMQRRRMMMAMRIRKGKPKFRKDKWEQFIEAIKPYTMAVTKEDVGMTPATIHRVPVMMFGRQRRAYEQLERDMVVDVGKLTVTTALKIVRNGKLQQLTGGFIRDEDRRVHVVGEAKLRKLHVLLKRVKPPVAIFARYTPEIELIEEACRDYSDRVAVISGRVKDTKTNKRRTRVMQAFQRGELDYVVCQQKTGGVGIDLYRARKAFVYSMSHSGIDFEQMVSRLDFIHQDSTAEFFLLYVPETIDEDQLTAIDEKRSVSEVTLERLKRRR